VIVKSYRQTLLYSAPKENITEGMLHEDRDSCKVLQFYMATWTPQSLEHTSLSKAHLPQLLEI